MGGGAAALQKDVPWRAASGAKPIPKIHYSPILRIPQNPHSDYALSIMKVRFFFLFSLGGGVGYGIYLERCNLCGFFLDWELQHPDPIGSGLGKEAIVEAAGPDCIVPGQNPPIKLLGFKVLLSVSVI